MTSQTAFPGASVRRGGLFGYNFEPEMVVAAEEAIGQLVAELVKELNEVL